MVGVVGAGVGIGGVGIGAGAGAGARTGTVTVAEFQTFEEVASNCFLSGEEFICLVSSELVVFEFAQGATVASLTGVADSLLLEPKGEGVSVYPVGENAYASGAARSPNTSKTLYFSSPSSLNSELLTEGLTFLAASLVNCLLRFEALCCFLRGGKADIGVRD